MAHIAYSIYWDMNEGGTVRFVGRYDTKIEAKDAADNEFKRLRQVSESYGELKDDKCVEVNIWTLGIETTLWGDGCEGQRFAECKTFQVPDNSFVLIRWHINDDFPYNDDRPEVCGGFNKWSDAHAAMECDVDNLIENGDWTGSYNPNRRKVLDYTAECVNERWGIKKEWAIICKDGDWGKSCGFETR